MLASPADGSDGRSASTLIRACVMDLLDPRTLGACSQASVRLHGVRNCQISAAVDLVKQTRHGVYDQRRMQLTKVPTNKRLYSRRAAFARASDGFKKLRERRPDMHNKIRSRTTSRACLVAKLCIPPRWIDNAHAAAGKGGSMSMRVLIGSPFAAMTVASTNVSAGEFVEIDSGTKAEPLRLIGYLARPQGAGPFSAVVLLRGWGGFHSSMISWADRLSRHGYAALAIPRRHRLLSRCASQLRSARPVPRADERHHDQRTSRRIQRGSHQEFDRTGARFYAADDWRAVASTAGTPIPEGNGGRCRD
jgi:hypothetical protein